MELAKRLDGVSEYFFAKKLMEIDEMNKHGIPVLNLGIGSPDLPPHPDVINTLAVEAAKPNVHGYQSYKGIISMRTAFADWYKLIYSVDINPATEILPLIGSKEGILHISMTFLNKGDKVLVPNPGYPTYQAATKLAEAECVFYNLVENNNWEPDFTALENSDLTSVKLMWINYPHMPTGALPSTALFKKFVNFAKKHHVLLCHDNPYSLILNPVPMSIFHIDGAKDNAIELNSLSKSHNMAGWRIGALFGNQEYVNAVMRFRSNMDSGSFLPMQAATVTALGLDSNWYASNNKVYSARRTHAAKILELLNCRFSESQGGLFMWAKIPDDQMSGFTYSDTILEKCRVFITPGGIFGSAGDRYIRISLCSPAEKLAEAYKRIQEIL